MSRKITFLTLFLWLMTVTFPVIAQQKADTTYTFRFVTQKDMFYVPWNGNDTELARLLECIENNKATILDGKLPLLVDGYCNSQSSEVKNLATAKIRANRVKSELITRAKIKEENFITRNHVTEGDFVTVRLTVPVKETAVTDAEAEARRKAEAERLETEKRAEQERLAEEQRKAEEARLAAEKAEAEKTAQQNTLADTLSETKITTDYHLSLRANLLRWATLTPDLGLEWRICPSWGIAVNGSWTSWSWSDKDRRYALWEVAPEVRYYMGEKKAWHLGAMFKAGQFNYKLSETGKQGDLMGGGSLRTRIVTHGNRPCGRYVDTLTACRPVGCHRNLPIVGMRRVIKRVLHAGREQHGGCHSYHIYILSCFHTLFLRIRITSIPMSHRR